MKVYGDDFVVSRNESFVYDRKLCNKDGSPYIVSMRYTAPMIRFTLADADYISEGRYVLNRYLDLSTNIVPKFYLTTPIRLMGETGYATTFDDYYPGDEYNEIPQIEGVDSTNYAVYYIVDEDGNKIYKRWVYDAVELEYHWTDYNLRIVLPFGVDITSMWTSKNYLYGIFFMDGTKYLEVMREYCARLIQASEGITYQAAYIIASRKSEQELYDMILEDNNKDGHVTDVALIDGREVVIDIDDPRWSPYWTVDSNIPLLNTAKVTVKNDALGGLL